MFSAMSWADELTEAEQTSIISMRSAKAQRKGHVYTYSRDIQTREGNGRAKEKENGGRNCAPHAEKFIRNASTRNVVFCGAETKGRLPLSSMLSGHDGGSKRLQIKPYHKPKSGLKLCYVIYEGWFESPDRLVAAYKATAEPLANARRRSDRQRKARQAGTAAAMSCGKF